MTTNPNQGQQPDAAESYGGYTGYRPPNPVDDPYGASRQGGSQESDPNYVYGQQTQGRQSSDSQTQQQFSYEPPESVLRKQRKRSSGSSTSFSSAASQGPVTKDDRKSALYSYLGICFTGIVFFFVKSKRPFVRFHAAQSVILFVPILALLAVLSLVGGLLGLIPLGIGWLLAGVIALIVRIIAIPVFILWIALMVLAYQGIRVKLPIIGHYAEALVARFSSDERTA